VLLANPGGNTVIGYYALFVGKHRVTCFTNGLLYEAKGVKPIHKFSRIGPTQFYTAQGADIDNANAASYGVDFLLNLDLALRWTAVIGRSLPIARRHHLGIQCEVAVVQWRSPERVKAPTGQ
jgi:hypothetical protein